MKQCRMCKVEKPLDEFHKRSRARDGHQSRCKDCAIALARQWYADNKERALDQQREYSQRPEVIAARRKYCSECTAPVIRDDGGRKGMCGPCYRKSFGTCSVEGCENRAHSRSMCGTHYRQWRVAQKGDRLCGTDWCDKVLYADGLCHSCYDRRKRKIDTRIQRAARKCSVDGCHRAYAAAGYCHLHHQRVRLTGKPGPVDSMRRMNGEPRLGADGYVYVGKIGQHRLVMEQILGRPLRPGENVHHINGVRDDNRPENLELWNKKQPAGQRVGDKLAWCMEFAESYADEHPEVLEWAEALVARARQLKLAVA